MPPSFSFGTSQRIGLSKSTKNIPGPGEYEQIRDHNSRPPTWKIGSSKRGEFQLSKAPGPGAYDEVQVHKRQFPKYHFGQRPQNYQTKELTPGPGSYNPNNSSVLKNNEKYTFGHRLFRGSPYEVIKETSQGLGPGGYETNFSTLITRPSSKQGHQKRNFLTTKDDYPGVGQYDLRTETQGPFFQFTQDLRKPIGLDSNSISTPGPGAYQLSQMNKTLDLGKTIGTRITMQTEDRIKVPGPGQYEPYIESIKQNNPKYKIGSAKRNNQIIQENNPGPGTYHLNNADKKHPPNYKIGTEQRGQLRDQDNPGPGSYEIQPNIGEGTKYTMRLKPQQKNDNSVPSPQEYYPQLSQTNIRPKSTKIGLESRDTQNITTTTTIVPGPDQYYVANPKLGPQYTFGSEQRTKATISQNPGPGQYDIKQIIGNNPSYVQNSIQQKSLIKSSKQI